MSGTGTRTPSPSLSVSVCHTHCPFPCPGLLMQALFKLSVDFRKEETRFLNKVEAQKGLEQGSTLGFIEDEANK